MRRGTRVGQAYVSVTADGSGINKDIAKAVDDAGPEIEKSGEQHGKNYGDRFDEGFFTRIREKFAKRGEDGAFGFGNSTGTKAGDKVGDRVGSAMVERLRTRLAEADGLVERLGAKMEKALNSRMGQAKIDAIAHSLRTAENSAARLERELRSVMRAEGLVSGNRGGRKKDTGLTALDDWLSGTRFRNNALNILAKGLGGLVHGFELVGLGARDFVSNMKNAEEGASIFAKISAGFGANAAEGAGGFGGAVSKGLSSIAAAAPGVVVAVAAISFGLTILVSVINAVVAALVALASTIASALVGAAAVGAAGLAALAAAAGLTVLAFRSMTDAQSKAFKTNFFKPLHEEAIGLGQIMLQQMVPAFGEWSKHLQVALALIQPLASVMGGAFARAGNIITAALSGPGIQRFIAMLTTTLPGIVTHLSTALGGFLNGTASIFAVLLPYVLQFAVYLGNIATKFAEWANSAKGQNAIADFVTRAVISLRSLMGFLGAVGGLIGTLLFSSSSQKAGNSIFDDMTAAVKRFTAYISKDDRLKKWLAEGVTFSKALGKTIVTLGQSLQNLNQSGAIDAIARLVDIGAGAYHWFSQLPRVVQDLLNPLQGVSDLIGKIGSWVGLSGGGGGGKAKGFAPNVTATLLGPLGTPAAPGKPKPSTLGKNVQAQVDALIKSGNAALNATSTSAGGYLAKPKGGKPKYHNPYIAFANSLINDGPTVSAQIKNAMLSLNKAAAKGIREASQANSADAVQSALDSLTENLTTGAEQSVNTAQQALNTAAQSLASATTKSAAKAALRKVKQSQKDLKAALDNQKRLNQAAAVLAAQKVVNEGNVTLLLQGILTTNATLADYAEARSRVATLLNDANQKLTAAIALRDDYAKQVSDSIKSFGSLLSAQAQTIDGVQQALTSNDIVSNLQTKLDQIKKFQSDLRILLAQGLSNDAYKQIVDAGVEQGTQFADALLAGGNAAIQNTNDLVNQINGIANSLGGETSTRMYQAGVDAAQGLVDGLTSLSAQLDTAAYNLGTSIATAIQRALGIASPSRVLRNMMTYVGDGIVLGLGDQSAKVGTASSSLASMIAVSPTPPGPASGGSAVSGNDGPGVLWTGDIVTPTEDPHAVANEVLNELVGRL